MGYDGFDGVDGGFDGVDGVDGGFDGVDGVVVVSMALMGAPMASLASVAPRTLMALASVALVVPRIWVTDLRRRKLSNEMLRFWPMENWLGSSTKQTWVDGRIQKYETGWRCQNEEGVDGFSDLVCGR